MLDLSHLVAKEQQDLLNRDIEELAADRQHYPRITSEHFWPTLVDDAFMKQEAIKFKENNFLSTILKYIQSSFVKN